MTIERNVKKPRGIVGVIAAVEGFGKTSTLGTLPGLYMLDVDDGSYGLDCPLIKFDGTVSGMLALIKELELGKAPADLKNLGIDTADMLVQMLTKDLCERKHWSSMEDLDYGKCWGSFKPEWEQILDKLKAVARSKGINIILTLHISGDKTFTEKTTGKQWNRWAARLTPKCAEKLFSFSDLYFTGIYDVDTMQQKSGRGKLDIAVGETRMIYTEHSSDHDGKCRTFITMPDGSRMKKQMTLDEFQAVFAKVLEVSTDKNAKVGEFVESEAEAPSAPEPTPTPTPTPEPTPKPELKPLALKLTEITAQYGFTDDQVRKYCTKHNSKYGIDFAVEPLNNWPDDYLAWLIRGFDKAAVKIKEIQ